MADLIAVSWRPRINLAGHQNQTWWFTHNLFNRGNTVIPQIAITESGTGMWDEDGFFGHPSKTKIVTQWREHVPAMVDAYTGEYLEPQENQNKVLIEFDNMNGNSVTIAVGFIVIDH